MNGRPVGIGGSTEVSGASGGGESTGGAMSGGADSGTASGGSEGSGGNAGQISCVDVPPTDEFTCAEQAAWEKCDEDWMAGFCEQTCGRCTTVTPPARDCQVHPINPNASQATRNLLCYLHEISGTQVLSGQQETSWDHPEEDMSFYNELVGDYPAVLGADYLYPNGTTARSIAYAQAGGIVMTRYHMGAPPLEDTYENSQGTSNMANVTTPGTPEHQSLLAKLDYAAAELQRLEDANVPVIWAPYHEFQPRGWFWWAKGTPEQFRSLWEFTYDYLTNSKGLDNLIWLAPSSHHPSAAWFPWPEHYDLAGPDTYDAASEQPFSSLYSEVAGIVPDGLPIPLHETGTIPQPAAMFPESAPWLLWAVWAGYQRDTQRNTSASIRSAYEHPATITRGEVPPYR